MTSRRPIFVYHDTVSTGIVVRRDPTAKRPTSYLAFTCPFCNLKCSTLRKHGSHDMYYRWNTLAACVNCGWWSFDSQQDVAENLFDYHESYSSRAILKSFAVDDPNVPYVELARYLARHHDRLVDIHPAKFEELVAAIYREYFGYRVEFCSYGRPDHGIDVLCGLPDSGQTFAIQVKRYRNPIELAAIHQFLGALLLNRQRSGVFVTTSRFRSGCYEVAEESSDLLGIEIDLVDGKRLLEFLALLNKKSDYIHCGDWARFGSSPGSPVDSRVPISHLKKGHSSRVGNDTV